MSILSDGDILAALESGDLVVEPFVEENLTPNGLDLTVAEVFVPGEHDEPVSAPGTGTDGGKVVVPPRTRFVVSTEEVVDLGPRICAQLWIRSTYARRGVLASFGKVEAGFEGTLTIGAFNAASEPLGLPLGDRFCQIVFEEMRNPPRALYEERSGTYQGQRGVTLADDNEA